MPDVKHQLNIALDFDAHDTSDWVLRFAYCYPHSEPPIGEQYLYIQSTDLDASFAADIEDIYQSVVRKIPAPDSVRLPHAEHHPDVVPRILTLVLQDQSRANELPVARLYYLIKYKFKIAKEEYIRLERTKWSNGELQTLIGIKNTSKKLCWEHYSKILDDELFVD